VNQPQRAGTAVQGAAPGQSPGKGTIMTTTRPPAAEGYWTIQVIRQERAEVGPRYVVHASDAAAAGSMAGHLAGASAAVVGYDIYRIDNPHGAHARQIALGQSESIIDPDAWAVLQAARRSA